MQETNILRITLPSDGALYDSTLEFMKACNLRVQRPNARRYTGMVPNLKDTTALFQRTADITSKVEEASADLGITGLDRFLEYRREDGETTCLIENLHFGGCRLVIAVPDAWLDVTSMSDLADLSLDFRQSGRQLRIATKYPRLVRRHLLDHGIHHFTFVAISGAIEAAPGAGFADAIADLTASGETLRENRLRPLDDGIVLSSQACLIGNKTSLRNNPQVLKKVQTIMEMMEAYLQAQEYFRLSANMQGTSAQDIAARVLQRPDLSGFQGPTVSKVYNVIGKGWYAVSLVVSERKLIEVVEHLREIGATEVSTSRLGYMFKKECTSYSALVKELGG